MTSSLTSSSYTYPAEPMGALGTMGRPQARRYEAEVAATWASLAPLRLS